MTGEPCLERSYKWLESLITQAKFLSQEAIYDFINGNNVVSNYSPSSLFAFLKSLVEPNFKIIELKFSGDCLSISYKFHKLVFRLSAMRKLTS